MIGNNHSYNNNYGGVFIWELNQDKVCNNTSELLNATWEATSSKFITINTQPAPTTNVVQGSISGSLSVAASANPSCTYQWYSNNTNSNTGGTIINGATNASYTIPTTLSSGQSPYYYFCELKAGVTALRSSVATVTVIAPLVISGPVTAKCKATELSYSVGQITGATYI